VTFLPALASSHRPSVTAQWTTLVRARELYRPSAQRIVTDRFAPLFLDGAHRAALHASRFGGAPLRWVERREVTALAAFVLLRHRFIDEQLLSALDAGAEQVVVLGAGYDARAYRFADRLAGRPVFEVDLPATSRRKAGIVAAHPGRFADGTVIRVEIDFATESLSDRLVAAGFVPGAGTFTVWEGVSMYLDRGAVGATLDTLGELCGPGSAVAMDLWDGAGGTGPLAPARQLVARSLRLVGEPVLFGVRPERVGDLFREHGFSVTGVLTGPELARRYATDGRRGESALYVAAAATPARVR
jgi:methyltransferase (TIGR00027 family)